MLMTLRARAHVWELRAFDIRKALFPEISSSDQSLCLLCDADGPLGFALSVEGQRQRAHATARNHLNRQEKQEKQVSAQNLTDQKANCSFVLHLYTCILYNYIIIYTWMFPYLNIFLHLHIGKKIYLHDVLTCCVHIRIRPCTVIYTIYISSKYYRYIHT